MLKPLASILKLAQSSSTSQATSPTRGAAPTNTTAAPSTPFTLDSFQRESGALAATKGLGLKLDDGVPDFGGKWKNELKGFEAQPAATSDASALMDSVARSKAAGTVNRAAQALMETVGNNSWADHVDGLRTAIGGAAQRLAEAVTSGAVTPGQALEQVASWQHLVSSLVTVPKGARADDTLTSMRIDAQAFQHHRAIEAFEGRADFAATSRLVETVARQVPETLPADGRAEFARRMGMVRELAGLTPPRDFLDFAGQFPALRDELLPQLGPVTPSTPHGMGLLFDESAPTVAPFTGTTTSATTSSAATTSATTTQPAAFTQSLEQAFSGPRVTSAEAAAVAARGLQQGVVSPFSASEDAWALAGDTSAKRAALDAALEKSGGVMTKELWQAMPASARDLYRANEVVASFKDNGFVTLAKDGFDIPRKSMGGSGEGRLTMFKADGLNLVVDQHMGGYSQANGANVGNPNLSYIYESKLRVGSDLVEFGRFDKAVTVNGRPVTVGAKGLTLADGSTLTPLPDGGGYRVKTSRFELDVSYYRNIETGVPMSGLQASNPNNLLESDPSQPQTWLQSYQVRNTAPGPVQAQGLLGEVMTEQSLRVADRAVERKTDLWRMDLSPWLATDFSSPT